MPATINGGSTPRATHSSATSATMTIHFDTLVPKITLQFTVRCLLDRDLSPPRPKVATVTLGILDSGDRGVDHRAERQQLLALSSVQVLDGFLRQKCAQQPVRTGQAHDDFIFCPFGTDGGALVSAHVRKFLPIRGHTLPDWRRSGYDGVKVIARLAADSSRLARVARMPMRTRGRMMWRRCAPTWTNSSSPVWRSVTSPCVANGSGIVMRYPPPETVSSTCMRPSK